jgi:biopolymer transport protein ExbB
MEKGATSELAVELADSASPEARVLLEGIKCRNLPSAERDLRMQARDLREIGALEKNVSYLSSVANIETMLGLLGTVTGMIRSFISLRLSGVADPAVLAGGIAEALITTAAGLLIAIPSLVAFHVFRQIINRTTSRIEMASTDLQLFIARRRGVA